MNDIQKNIYSTLNPEQANALEGIAIPTNITIEQCKINEQLYSLLSRNLELEQENNKLKEEIKEKDKDINRYFKISLDKDEEIKKLKSYKSEHESKDAEQTHEKFDYLIDLANYPGCHEGCVEMFWQKIYELTQPNAKGEILIKHGSDSAIIYKILNNKNNKLFTGNYSTFCLYWNHNISKRHNESNLYCTEGNLKKCLNNKDGVCATEPTLWRKLSESEKKYEKAAAIKQELDSIIKQMTDFKKEAAEN